MIATCIYITKIAREVNYYFIIEVISLPEIQTSYTFTYMVK